MSINIPCECSHQYIARSRLLALESECEPAAKVDAQNLVVVLGPQRVRNKVQHPLLSLCLHPHYAVFPKPLIAQAKQTEVGVPHYCRYCHLQHTRTPLATAPRQPLPISVHPCTSICSGQDKPEGGVKALTACSRRGMQFGPLEIIHPPQAFICVCEDHLQSS